MRNDDAEDEIFIESADGNESEDESGDESESEEDETESDDETGPLRRSNRHKSKPKIFTYDKVGGKPVLRHRCSHWSS